MNSSLKVGDVVQLLSGGPIMTVSEDANQELLVLTGWFDSQDQLQYGRFLPQTLKLVEAPK